MEKPTPPEPGTVEQVIAGLRAELRKQPRYWMRVSDRPMERSAQAVFVADIERAVDTVAAALASSVPSGGSSQERPHAEKPEKKK